MLQTEKHTLNRQPSQVTVTFGDGAHSFPLKEGATLSELAKSIGALGTHHDGAPISIDIEFKTSGASSSRPSQPHLSIKH